MAKEMSKLRAVTHFVMDGVNRILADEWDGTYNVGTPQEIDFIQALPARGGEGHIEAWATDGNYFLLQFGEEWYQVKISRLNQPPE